MANFYRRWSTRPPEKLHCTKKSVSQSWLYLWQFWKYLLKIYKLENILSGGLASPNHIFPPSQKLEIFGAVSEDDSDQILRWGHININSAIKYLSFKILWYSELVENWRWYRFLKKFWCNFPTVKAEQKGKIYLLSSCKSWIEGKQLLSIQLPMLNRR